MLSLAASWGVFSLAAKFVPWPVAIVTAFAFELTYIGLAVARGLTSEQRKRARRISISAVGVSILYNWVSGLLDINPGLFESAGYWAKALLAGLHGVPLALLAYFVADLLLHTEAAQDIVKFLQDKIKDLQEQLTGLESRELDLQDRVATLETDNATLQGFITWLKSFNNPIVYDNETSEFRALPAPEPGRTLDITGLTQKLSILGSCLIARKVTPGGAALTGMERGEKFDKPEFDAMIKTILEGIENE